jgi:UDPglucose 6-dehydrogenase
MPIHKIAIIGTGYVGMVTGTCLASKGNEVLCVDNNLSKIQSLQSGKTPIFEPYLEDLMKSCIANNTLTFTDQTIDACNSSDIIFLCLPTPSQEAGSADLSYVKAVCDLIAPSLNSPKIIVNKSTVPVGTTKLIQSIFDAQSIHKSVVISNPEFLREGFAVNDFLNPDRIIIGTQDQTGKDAMLDLYSEFVEDPNLIVCMDAQSSEMTKYAANSFLATKISFINEVANMCEKLGANIDNVAKGIGLDPRIGNRFLKAGIGYGGSCFPKDVKALNNTSNQSEYKFDILEAVININHKQKRIFVDKICAYYNRVNLKGLKFAVWGLSFKADTDDIRDSASIEIIELLLKKSANINCFDPEGMTNFKLFHSDLDVVCSSNQYEALDEVDGLIILTDWQKFKEADFVILAQKMKHKVIFDGRNIWSKDYPISKGFDYISVGR